MSDDVQLIGFDDLDKSLRNPTWVTRPLIKLFDTWRFAGQRQTVQNMKRGPGGWIDQGHDRRTVTSERDMSDFPQWAKFGSNSKKIRWGEFGTGLLSEDPKSSHRRHWPPAAALDKWAAKKKIERKGHPGTYLTGRDIARIIGVRGGLKPRRMFRDAEKTIKPKVGGWLATMAKDIEAEANRQSA